MQQKNLKASRLLAGLRSILIPALLICSLSAGKSWAQVNVSYRESFEDFPNPERGFYVPKDTYAGKFLPLDPAVLKDYRTRSQAHGSATYAIFSTLFYRGYVLDTFRDKRLSFNFLQDLEGDFRAARTAGIKLIIRFAYTNKSHTGDCADESRICPPYGDASKEIILQHIAQLKPVLTRNADVIAVLQEGFIGIWGENYFTDYFGDASENGEGRITDSSWRNRNDILKALLAALPPDRMVQVRTPQIKQKFVYGPEADVTVRGLTEKEAFDFSDKARVGFHNDCFLSGPDDYGTFYDYGSSSRAKKPANAALRKYFEEESRYGPSGGETCDDIFSPQNDCGPAEKVMAAGHYSFLNTAYNNKVNNDWDSGGCIENIKKSLGYRLVLHTAAFPARLKTGDLFSFTFKIENVGYASPYNPRPLQLVFRNTASGKEFFADCKTDIRFWFTGSRECKETVPLPKGISPGTYKLFLNLPDKYPSIAKNPAYSIRLANEGLWEERTGYNDLQHAIPVTR